MTDSTAFPWLKHLPEDAAREFFEELSGALADAQMHTMPGVKVSPTTYVEHVDVLIHAWKATAEVHADPELYRALTEPEMGDYGPVLPPEHTDKIREAAKRAAEKPKPVTRKLCASQIPRQDLGLWARSHWCNRTSGHNGDHISREGKRWTDAEEAVAWNEPHTKTTNADGTIPGQREGGHENDL